MNISLRVLMILVSILTNAYILAKVHHAKVKIEYSIFWIVISGILLIFSIFPRVPGVLSQILGFQAPVNFILVFIIFVLMLKVFLNSLMISKMEDKINTLARIIAVEEALRVSDKEEPGDDRKKEV